MTQADGAAGEVPDEMMGGVTHEATGEAMGGVEWLDIVDELDRVTGRATRDDIHREQHLHRSTHIVLTNGCGDVFVQLRSLYKDSSPGLWDTSAAGHVDSGESYLGCAVRELSEELGITTTAEALEFLGRLPPDVRNGFEFTEVYLLCSEQALVLQEEEIQEGRWVSVAELDAWTRQQPAEFTDVFLAIWAILRARENQAR